MNTCKYCGSEIDFCDQVCPGCMKGIYMSDIPKKPTFPPNMLVTEGSTKPTTTDACTWNEDIDSVWNTTCGRGIYVEAENPTEAGMKFCYVCGKKITWKHYECLETCDLCHDRFPTSEVIIGENDQMLCKKCAK